MRNKCISPLISISLHHLQMNILGAFLDDSKNSFAVNPRSTCNTPINGDAWFIISSMSDSCMFHTNLGSNADHGCWCIFLYCNWTIYVKRLQFCRHVRYHKNNDTFSPQSTLPCKTNRPFNWQWLTDSQQTQNIGINVFSASQWSAHFVGQIVLSQWRECVVVFTNNMPALFASFVT